VHDWSFAGVAADSTTSLEPPHPAINNARPLTAVRFLKLRIVGIPFPL
jgi:hypothetical protein